MPSIIAVEYNFTLPCPTPDKGILTDGSASNDKDVDILFSMPADNRQVRE